MGCDGRWICLWQTEKWSEPMEVYLDNAATTRVTERAKEAVNHAFDVDYGNPSSRHTKGMEAENIIKGAAQTIAKTLRCEPGELVFTSGGTESNNMALIGTALANQRRGKHIITTRIEHPSVYEPLGWLEKQGFQVTYLPVDADGHVEPEVLRAAITPETILVSVMYVNNEIGACMDVASLGQIVHEQSAQALFHVDAIQAYGKYKITPKKEGIDLLSVSGHKIHGPKGVGFLYVSDSVKIHPVIFGGGQQKGRRSGTENVPGIAGLAAAVSEVYENPSGAFEKMMDWKIRFIQEVSKIQGVTVNGIAKTRIEDTAPHIISVSFAGVRSEVLLHALADKEIYVSSGSACSSNHPDISGTLKAIGVEDNLLDSTLRFSIAKETTDAQMEYTLECLAQLVPMLRRYTRH